MSRKDALIEFATASIQEVPLVQALIDAGLVREEDATKYLEIGTSFADLVAGNYQALEQDSE